MHGVKRPPARVNSIGLCASTQGEQRERVYHATNLFDSPDFKIRGGIILEGRIGEIDQQKAQNVFHTIAQG